MGEIPVDDEMKEDLKQAGLGVAKSVLSKIPFVGQAFAGLDAYKRSSHDRNVKNLLDHLSRKTDNIEEFFKSEYFRTEEGEEFARKVIDCALDMQLQEKQELFVNALINAPSSDFIPHLEKLRFVDILRHLSLASLIILAHIHKKLIGQVKGPGRKPRRASGPPHVDSEDMARELSNKYDPYLVTSAIREMEGQGLFSPTEEWQKEPTSDRYRPSYITVSGSLLYYTEFSARFAEFIQMRDSG